jgi:hypothetical protein
MEPIPMKAPQAKFELGQVVITPAASAALGASGQGLGDLLALHQAGDWGDVNEQVRAVNDRGLTERFNLQSSYVLASGERLVIVTDRDRTLTMIHLDPGRERREDEG